MWTWSSWPRQPPGGSACGDPGNGDPCSQLDRGPLISVLKAGGAKTSQKPLFLSEGGQRLKVTPEDLRNQSIKELGVDPVSQAGWDTPSLQIQLDTTGKDGILRSELASVKSKGNKRNFSGFPRGGTGRPSQRLTSFPGWSWGTAFAVLFSAKSVSSFHSRKVERRDTAWSHAMLERSP